MLGVGIGLGGVTGGGMGLGGLGTGPGGLGTGAMGPALGLGLGLGQVGGPMGGKLLPGLGGLPTVPVQVFFDIDAPSLSVKREIWVKRIVCVTTGSSKSDAAHYGCCERVIL